MIYDFFLELISTILTLKKVHHYPACDVSIYGDKNAKTYEYITYQSLEACKVQQMFWPSACSILLSPYLQVTHPLICSNSSIIMFCLTYKQAFDNLFLYLLQIYNISIIFHPKLTLETKYYTIDTVAEKQKWNILQHDS